MSSDDLSKRAFISAMMVGPCPRCGSQNTHDCFYDEEEHHPEFECPLIKAVDDPLIGHCENCDAVFCRVPRGCQCSERGIFKRHKDIGGESLEELR